MNERLEKNETVALVKNLRGLIERGVRPFRPTERHM